MASRPTFSIATPTRNALDGLRRCVGSVRGQGPTAREHLIRDACSSDGTPAWLAAQPDLVSVSEPDSGMYDAINRAWREARGEYLSWLNADEQYLPGTLATVERYFSSNPDVDVLFGDYVVARADGRPVALRREIPMRAIYVKNSFLNAMSCTLFYRRRLLDRGLLRLDAAYRYAADKDLILRLAEAGAVIRHVPEYLAIFGIDGCNMSTHPQMEAESLAIGRQYGALPWRPLRFMFKIARRAERLVRGAYRPDPIHYSFATNEVPDYVVFDADRRRGRYRISDGRAHVSEP